MEKPPDLAEFLSDDKWLAHISYLADLYNEVNKLNKKMLGGNTNSIAQHKRVEAFKRKLKL